MLLSSTAGTAVTAVNDDHESVIVDSGTKAEGNDDDSASSDSIVAIRHRGGYSLSTTTTFMPIFFIIQLYAFLQVGFWGMVGV